MALTFIFNAFSFRDIQVRLSEALTVLPVFTNSAVPGLFVGCFLANLISGAPLPDVVFGSLATLAGAAGTYFLGRKNHFLAPLPPITANTLIVPLVLRYAYGIETAIPLMMLTVGIGENISCGVLGLGLYYALRPNRDRIFGSEL